MPNEILDISYVLARMVALEHDIYNWDSVLATMGGGAPATEIERAKLIRQNSQAELTQTRALVDYYNRHNGTSKIPIPLHVGAIVVALYAALMLAVVIYLIALAR